MAYSWIFVGIFLLIGVGGGYAIASRIWGQEVAYRRLRDTIPFFLLGVLIAWASSFGIPVLETSYIFFSLSILYAIFIAIYLLSWLWRKKKAGFLVLDLGRTVNNKILLGLGLIETLSASAFTFVFLDQVSSETNYSGMDEIYLLSLAIFLWTLAIFFFGRGVSRLQIRENGLCYQCSILNWHKIISYAWEESKPSILTFRLQQKSPFLPKLVSLKIPPDKQNEVEYILANYVPGQTSTGTRS